MKSLIVGPASATIFSIPVLLLAAIITVAGLGAFAYIMVRRLAPLRAAAPEPRCDDFGQRMVRVAKYWLAQWKHPRYRLAGVLHIVLFAGFLTLGLRNLEMALLGFFDSVPIPGMDGPLGYVYTLLREYAATGIFIVVIIAAARRLFFQPDRYRVPARYGKDHTAEAVFVLGLICTLVVTESLFDAAVVAAPVVGGAGGSAPLSLVWWFSNALSGAPVETLQAIHIGAYVIHDATFFFFLCFLPLGKHFHVITSLFNVFFMRLEKGTVKPVRFDVDEDGLDDLESFGTKALTDFTWKHVLDFYSCVDCGRCSDNCPANAVARPLSPRFISIKGRDAVYNQFRLWPPGAAGTAPSPLVGSVYDEDEIWSCTTCGACEEECPVTIEYIDKIVDLRRAMVDDGLVPQSLQKPLAALEKRGNPWGKMERKRADWVKADGFADECPVPVVGKKESSATLFFVDSIMSYDDRMQDIARASARVLNAAGVDFGILGPKEKDSGHEARRFGEEMLYLALRDQNTDAISESGAERIVVTDPHAYNALKKDYTELPPVAHITEIIATAIADGTMNLKPLNGDGAHRYTFHDPCYLGRHNGLYDAPREIMDAVPGLARVEMARCRDRAFCCGGGGLMLFYEPEEEQRMGVLRVKMAAETGADTIVTACPFCLVNIEDAIKVAGFEGKIQAIDLTELVAQQLDV